MADGIDGLLDAAANLHGRWVTATRADGRKMVEWIENEGLVLSHSHKDSVRKWKNGEDPSVWVVDRVLTANGRHLWELPDELWVGETSPDYDEARFCQVCGEEIARRGPNGKRKDRWNQRRFCDRDCQDRFHRSPEVNRTCAVCGKGIHRNSESLCHDCYQEINKKKFLFGKDAA